MHEANPKDAGLRAQGRRGEAPDESGGREPSRLAGLEREHAAMEMFARVAAHELMAPLIASETRARLLEDQLHDRDDGRARADLQDLIRSLSRMRQLVETLLHDARSSGVPLERRPVNLQQLVPTPSSRLMPRSAPARSASLPPSSRSSRATACCSASCSTISSSTRCAMARATGRRANHARRDGAMADLGHQPGRHHPGRGPRPHLRALPRGTHERRVAGAGLGLAICRSIVSATAASSASRPSAPAATASTSRSPPPGARPSGPANAHPLTAARALTITTRRVTCSRRATQAAAA